MNPVYRLGWHALTTLAAALAVCLFAAGCGTPGAPLPPSLKLPDRVADLSAIRTGNQIALTWTMPRKNTDKLLLKGEIPVRVCRREGKESCATVPGSPALAPGAKGTFTETLPPAFSSGPPRILSYFVELNNRRGRSAGLSNAAVVLAGDSPAPVAGLAAQVRKQGIVLRWNPGIPSTQGPDNTVIRLHRTLLTPEKEAKPKAQKGALAPPPEPHEQSLLVESGDAAARALDKNIRFGETYEYRAQRVARVAVDGQDKASQTASQTLELASPLSDPVRVEVRDIFPPAVPSALAAVATGADSAVGSSIDLSWQPVADTDLSGYAVYRREAGGDWLRISPASPIAGPAFHDANVQPGHTYSYSVSAIDQSGHESARSAETEETVPNP